MACQLLRFAIYCLAVMPLRYLINKTGTHDLDFELFRPFSLSSFSPFAP